MSVRRARPVYRFIRRGPSGLLLWRDQFGGTCVRAADQFWAQS